MLAVQRTVALLVCFFSGYTVWATDLDTIGVTLLRTTVANLNGSGIRVAQPEAELDTNGLQWEVNPASVGQSPGLFTWVSTNGTSANFPNNVGAESGHADAVGYNFYGTSAGAAPGVQHVDNYQADYFYETIVAGKVAIPARLVNQSFITTGDPPDQEVQQAYDDYIAQYGTLFCSSVGNGGQVYPPATCYNGIGVGVYGASSSIGPTLDDGRSKPDIVAPGGATSFSAPYVSGAAALLLQAAARGDGGADTNAASDSRTIKALLLNGAVKPSTWTHTYSAPLDKMYGAGLVNVFNSYQQFAKGQQPANDTSLVATGAAHLPTGNPNNVSSPSGWDFRALTNTPSQDVVNHYYLNLPASSGSSFVFTATLVWEKQLGLTNINDLDLFLYDTISGALMASSISTVDNVEHLYLTQIPAGRYDLQVLKNGAAKSLTPSETYALAFEAFAPQLSLNHMASNAVISWPVYPAGFSLESIPGFRPSNSWATVTNVLITNNLNQYTVSTVYGLSFYRLKR